MNILIHYGTAVATVPTSALGVMERATKNDLKVLLTLCADPTLLSGDSFGACVGNLAIRLNCTPAQIETSLSFWRGAGVLNIVGEGVSLPTVQPTASEPVPTASAEIQQPEAKGKQETSTAPKPRPAPELPRYTSAELAVLLESREETAAYLKECENIWGKMFNPHEYNIVLALVDYLGLEWDYVLALLSYAAKYYRERDNQGKSLSYVERMAFSLHKEGIVTTEALQNRFKEMENMATLEYKLRKLFGMGEGALTPTQKKMFSTWVYEYRFDMEIIRMAYNRAVDNTGSSKINKLMNYVNRTLGAWNEDNLRTPEQIEAADAAFRAARDGEKAGKPQTGSFDTDDFFAAAVRRSLGDDFDPDKQGA